MSAPRVLLVDGDREIYDEHGELLATSETLTGRWDMGAVLTLAALLFEYRPGVVVLTAEAMAELDLAAPGGPPVSDTDHRVLVSARAAGWKVTRVAPWMSFWRDSSAGHPRISVACFPWLDAKTGPLLREGEPVWGFAENLARFHELTGTAFYATPGVTGLALMRECTSLSEAPRWSHPAKPGLAPIRHAEDDYRAWDQPGNAVGAFEHTYDAIGMYLGTVGAVRLPIGELAYARGGWFNPKLGGYWQIVRPTWNNPNVPHPCGNHHPESGLIWVTTPTMELLAELADDGLLEMPDVIASWTAKSGRVLRQWQERLRNALAGLDDNDQPEMRRAIKATYAEAIGLLGREGGRVHRVDWRHHIIGQARVNLFRRMWRLGDRTGRWPVRVRVDAITYASDEFDAVAGCPNGLPLGEGLGKFRVLGSARATARV